MIGVTIFAYAVVYGTVYIRNKKYKRNGDALSISTNESEDKRCNFPDDGCVHSHTKGDCKYCRLWY